MVCWPQAHLRCRVPVGAGTKDSVSAVLICGCELMLIVYPLAVYAWLNCRAAFLCTTSFTGQVPWVFSGYGHRVKHHYAGATIRGGIHFKRGKGINFAIEFNSSGADISCNCALIIYVNLSP